jgi:hypothetical protein
MKNKLLTLMIAGFFLMIFMLNFVSSEVYLYNNVEKVNSTGIVVYSAFYFLDDTSSRGFARGQDIPVYFNYVVEPLPLNLSNSHGVVDWCNFTITHAHNIYGTTFVAFQGFFGGELLNTTIETQSYYFDNNSLNSGAILINMRDKDSISAKMKCHYSDSNYLYDESILAGRFTTFMPSYECEGCTQYTLQDLSNQVEQQDNITANELAIYNNIQTAVSWNFQIWLIVSWILKIGFIFLGIALIFLGAYWFYLFLQNIARQI